MNLAYRRRPLSRHCEKERSLYAAKTLHFPTNASRAPHGIIRENC